MSQAREHESHAGAKGLQEKHSSAHGTYAAGQRDAEVAGSVFEPCIIHDVWLYKHRPHACRRPPHVSCTQLYKGTWSGLRR